MSALRHIVSLVLLLGSGSAWLACTATNTGNPHTDDPLGTGPKGIALVRSALEREQIPAVPDADLATFATGSTDFAFDLYAQAVSGEDNTFISPYSVRAALGMLYAGARGETKSEMASALHFDLPEPTLHAAMNATDLSLALRSEQLVPGEGEERSGDLLLRPVNAAFGRKGLMFQEPFLDVLAQHYGTGMFAADFAGNPERERMAINQWVEEQTNDRIVDLLPTGSIDPTVALVLVNSIYFKGSWLAQFNAANTARETFHGTRGDVSVPMMNETRPMGYTEGAGYSALELFYIAPALRMLLILPDEGSFASVEASLGRELFDEIRTGFSDRIVTLKVPKFSFRSSLGLVPVMRALGMNQAFDAGMADLSGIAGAPGDLVVSDIFHQAFIAVDEEGTEAAAATAVVAVPVSAPPPANFFLDRPFIFVIYDEPTGQILFLGRLMAPEAQ